MAGLAKAEYAKIAKRSHFIVSLSVLHHSYGKGSLISGCVRSIRQVDLAEAIRCNRHHVLVQDVNEIMGRHSADIYLSLEETIIEGRVTSVYHHIVIIAEGLSAIKIKDHIAISVLKEVALRLLQVDEAQRL